MRRVFLILSGLCAMGMIGGLIGFEFDDTAEDVPVPPPGTGVGFSDEPLEDSGVPAWLIDVEAELSWDADVWVGIVTEAEKDRCAPDGGLSTTCGPSTTNFVAGGPATDDAKSFTWAVESGTHYPTAGQSFTGTESSFDVNYTIHVQMSWTGLLILGILGSGFLVLSFPQFRFW